jgi:hypothetical protein
MRRIEEHAHSSKQHLLLGTSLPLFLTSALHDLEAWNEAVCDGAWGGPAAWVGEKVRQGLDLEHWAAFHDSFERMCDLIRDVGSGERAPATIVALSGDVHHAYLAEVGFKPGTGVRSHVYQAVCSPFRNPLDNRERRMMRAAASNTATHVTRWLARLAGVEPPSVGWRYTHDEAWFDNQVASLEFEGSKGRFRIEKTEPPPADDGTLKLECVFERDLS